MGVLTKLILKGRFSLNTLKKKSADDAAWKTQYRGPRNQWFSTIADTYTSPRCAMRIAKYWCAKREEGRGNEVNAISPYQLISDDDNFHRRMRDERDANANTVRLGKGDMR